jgi:hypothetical protein
MQVKMEFHPDLHTWRPLTQNDYTRSLQLRVECDRNSVGTFPNKRRSQHLYWETSKCQPVIWTGWGPGTSSVHAQNVTATTTCPTIRNMKINIIHAKDWKIVQIYKYSVSFVCLNFRLRQIIYELKWGKRLSCKIQLSILSVREVMNYMLKFPARVNIQHFRNVFRWCQAHTQRNKLWSFNKNNNSWQREEGRGERHVRK